MNATIIKALRLYCPRVLELNKHEQDIWKLEDHPEIDDHVCAFVLSELNTTAERIKNNKDEQFEYNKIMLHYRGIGSNYFMLNECSWDSDIFNHATLYEYNNSVQIRRNDVLEEYNSDVGNQFADWARTEINGNFFYLNVIGIHQWLYWQAECVVDEWIDAQIPHEYVPGPAHNSVVEGIGRRWKMHVNAYGRENEHDIMISYRDTLLTNIFNTCIYLDDAVYVMDDNTDQVNDPQLDYVFGSVDVLRKIRFATFIEDCVPLIKDSNELNIYKDGIVSEMIMQLESKLASIS